MEYIGPTVISRGTKLNFGPMSFPNSRSSLPAVGCRRQVTTAINTCLRIVPLPLFPGVDVLHVGVYFVDTCSIHAAYYLQPPMPRHSYEFGSEP